MKTVYWNLIKADYTTLVYVLGGISILLGIHFSFNALLILGISLFYIGFDVYGWNWMLKQGHCEEDSKAAYRIIQHGTFIPILYFAGLPVAIPVILYWGFGVFDYAYYLVGKFKFSEKYNHLGWLFPLGWWSLAKKEDMTQTQFEVNAIMGLLVGTGTALVFTLLGR